MRGPNLSALSVQQKPITLFIMFLIACMGVVSFTQLGRAEDPRITIRKMIVTAHWPGASVSEMEQFVVRPLEKRAQGLEYFDYIETTVRPGIAIMQIEVPGDTPTEEITEQWYQVRKKFIDERPNLPRDLAGLFFNDEFSDVYFGLIALNAKGLPHRDLVTQAEYIRSELLGLPGAQKIRILGEQPQEILIEMSNARLSRLGIAPAQIADALAQHNKLVATPFIETSGPRVSVRMSSLIKTIEDLKNLPLKIGNRTVNLGEVGDITYAYQDPPSYMIRHRGETSILLGVVMRHGYNGTAMGSEMRSKIAQISKRMPLGLNLETVSDQSRIIADAYGEFIIKFLFALVVVILVSLVTLGFRVGLIVAAAIPLTLSIVFAYMLYTGKEFDRISLGALILSLGLLVDDAIIAIESMVAKIRDGFEKISAASFAWNSTATPMLTGTLVTAFGFIPIGLSRSIAGEYAGNIFWITGFALLASWVVAVTFIPFLGVRFLQVETIRKEDDSDQYDSENYQKLRHYIQWCLDHPRKLFYITMAIFALSGLGMLLIPKQFYPTSNRTELLIEVRLQKGSSFSATQKSVEQIEGFVSKQPETKMETSYVGAGAARFFLTLNPERPDPSFAKIIVQTSSPENRDALFHKVKRAAYDGKFPNARVRPTKLLFGTPVLFPLHFRIYGPDKDKLREIAAEVQTAIASHPDVIDPHSDWGEKSAVVDVQFDDNKLRELGLGKANVSRQVATLLNGRTATEARINDRLVSVMLRMDKRDRANLDNLSQTPIVTPSGAHLTLGQIAKLKPVFAEQLVIRRNGKPAMSVVADVADGVQPPDLTAKILPLLDPIKAKLPPGFSIETDGTVAASAKARGPLLKLLPLTALLMSIVIMLQMRSFRLFALTWLTAPLGLIGAVLALLVTGMPFGFNAILGLIALSGILMRNTMILVDQIRSNLQIFEDRDQAVMDATIKRARPVILSGITTALAFVPLANSEFWGALAIVLIGGVLVATLLTLFFVPAVYTMLCPNRDVAEATAT